MPPRAAATDARASTPARPRRSRARRVVLALLALTVVGGLAGAAALAVVLRVPEARAYAVTVARGLRDRYRAYRAHAERELQAAQRPRAVLRCVPARTVGAPGTIPEPEDVPAGAVASALFVWADAAAPRAGDEIAALRTLVGADAGRDAFRELDGRPRAVALTVRGQTLRAARARAPRADVRLAAAGTRELCLMGT